MLRFYRIAYMVIENGNNEPNKHYYVVLNQLIIKMTRYYNKYVDNDNSPYNYIAYFCMMYKIITLKTIII